jgi:hypothetical protein
LYWADYRAAKTEKNLLYRHDKPNESTKNGEWTPLICFL